MKVTVNVILKRITSFAYWNPQELVTMFCNLLLLQVDGPYSEFQLQAAELTRHLCLTGKPILDWSTRKRIALGAARGLLYLHEQCDPKIIHRDVKAANILLDDCCEAVVGDFGLAKLLDHQDSHVTTAVRGTVGHIAPEYLSTGQSSEKTDVFGFGILLLELITGQRALEYGKAANQKGAMLDWVSQNSLFSSLSYILDKHSAVMLYLFI